MQIFLVGLVQQSGHYVQVLFALVIGATQVWIDLIRFGVIAALDETAEMLYL